MQIRIYWKTCYIRTDILYEKHSIWNTIENDVFSQYIPYSKFGKDICIKSNITCSHNKLQVEPYSKSRNIWYNLIHFYNNHNILLNILLNHDGCASSFNIILFQKMEGILFVFIFLI